MLQFSTVGLAGCCKLLNVGVACCFFFNLLNVDVA